MNEDQLAEQRISIEKYGYGFIVADYSGKRPDRRGQVREAVYAGISEVWVWQPITIGEPFPTKADAIAFAARGVEGRQNP